MRKMKFTVLSFFSLGCNVCSDQVLKLYCFSCISFQTVDAAALVPCMSKARSIELLYTYSASLRTLVSGAVEPVFPLIPKDCRRRSSNSSSGSLSNIFDSDKRSTVYNFEDNTDENKVREKEMYSANRNRPK